ncbi:MAG: sulfotransferase, partial [Alphaproteobacteria bacterium]|nr:sulfotransferase [Alphaproteobacteria bacterium]
KLGRPFFIDKMPNNFAHTGLIHLILPNSRIVDARRHPMGCCFSAYKQHFARGQAFSYDLGDVGRYYADYVSLMRHFDDVLPGRVHRVLYERMVDDPESEVRRLLDYCGLPFEAKCLQFYQNDRAVRTASSEQVRQPIFRDGVDQWQNFAPWLGPLEAALGPVLQEYTR